MSATEIYALYGAPLLMAAVAWPCICSRCVRRGRRGRRQSDSPAATAIRHWTESPLDWPKTPLGAQVPAIVSGLPEFLLYFATAVGLVALYLFVYSLATAHNELALIRQNVMSAALALGLSLIGFALPLSSAIVHAKAVTDVLAWGLVALVVQILIYWLVRLVVPNLSQRIASDELAAALFLGAASLAGGIINAASMTY